MIRIINLFFKWFFSWLNTRQVVTTWHNKTVHSPAELDDILTQQIRENDANNK